jgi:hypothetical protein
MLAKFISLVDFSKIRFLFLFIFGSFSSVYSMFHGCIFISKMGKGSEENKLNDARNPTSYFG